MKTYFVSGHLDVTADEFLEHYESRLRAAAGEGSAFIVGDAGGCDTLAQLFLGNLGCERVTVYHMLVAPRNNAGFPTIGGFTSDRARDAAMTAASTDDIAWVRPGREKSGTAQNLARRIKAR